MFSCVPHHEAGGAAVGSYPEHYMEIGQVTAAIMVQTLVDFLFSPEEARTKAVRLSKELLQVLREGFHAMFDEDIVKMKDCSDRGDKLLSILAQKGEGGLAFETDPSNRFFVGLNTPFKHAAYIKSLDHLGNIHKYLATMCV